MGKRITFIFTLLTMHLAAFAQQPLPFPAENLAAWYSADSVHLTADNHVDTLYDKSGNERHAIQLTAGKQPLWVESEEYINGQPTLYFDGNDFLSSSFEVTLQQPNTVFVIWKTTNVSGQATCFSGLTDNARNQLFARNNSIGIYSSVLLTSNQFHYPFNYSLFEAVFNRTESRLVINGEIVAEGNNGVYSTNGISIGSNHGVECIIGNITELIFFNGAISLADSAAVMEYLWKKYSDKRLLIDHKIPIDYGFAPVTYTAECDWAQSFLWDDGGTTPTIVISDAKPHTLTVTDNFGFKSSDTIVVEYPKIAQPDKNSVICAGDTLVWDTKLDGDYTYLWSDGTTEKSLRITTNGDYYVIVTDNEGYTLKSDIITVSVDSIGFESIIDDHINACSGEYISTNQSEGMSFLWSTGSNQSSIVVTQSGEYWVKVTNQHGCGVSDTTLVNINGITPTATFSYNAIESGKPAQFLNQSQSNDGSQISFVWDFGDGSVSVEQNPVHIFSRTGQYDVALMVSTESGCQSSSTETISVETNSSLLVETVAPAQSQNIYTENVLFKWKEIDGCERYNLQIATDNEFNNLITDIVVDLSSASINLENGTYYWRVKTDVGQFCNAKILYVSSISSISNIAAWFSADNVHLTADNHVDTLYDKSGNERHAIQLTVGKQPAWVESDEYINGQPTLYFDGNDFLSSSFETTLQQPNTVFVIWKTTNTTGQATCFSGLTDNARNQLFARNNSIGIYSSVLLTSSQLHYPFNYSLFEAVFNKTESKLVINGKIVAEGNNGAYSINGISIGSNHGIECIVGNISELIFFNREISLVDSAAVMEYFWNKYSGKRLLIDHRIPVDYGFAPVTYTAECDWAQSFLWDDGTVGPSVVISDENTHFLTVTDKFGFVSSDFIVVDYPTILQPDQNTTICAGDTLVWNAALNGPYTYLWNNGSTESSLEITTAGEYYVVITDTAGYSWKSETITVNIDSFPVLARLESENIEACIGNNIYLQNGYDEAVNYLWSDGTSADHLTVATSGIFWVRATDRLGCIATDTAHIEVLSIAPTTDFTHTALCATRDIEFSNQSHSNDASQINGYLWQFGDGHTSAEANPAHAYSYSGTYNLELTVSTTNGCRNLLKKTLIVDSLPTAAFAPAQACSFTPVQFADQSITSVSYITDWQWTMNDSTFAERNPSTTFNTWGDKPVRLVVATAHGCTDTLRSSISILQGPAVDFALSEPCLNTPLYCTNRTIGALNLAVGYVWQIDGEERSTIKSPDFNFSDTGSYRITLTAKQLSNGCSASKSKTISIKPLPKPVITAELICHNQPTAVSAENIEPQSVVSSWQWSVDGVQSAQKQSAWLTFESVGRHHLTVAATDTVGCVSKADTIVVVYPSPIAAFGITPERGPVPFEPRLINNSADADSYLWLLDGETSDAEEPQHTFADSGSHVIRLVAVNQFGCADTALRTVVAFVPNTDLLIMQAEAEPVGNYLRISAVVANNSPYDLANSTISVTDNLGHSIRETIADTIKSGKIIRYAFASEIESASNRLKYICINVEPASGSDNNPTNNQFCIAMNNDEFSIEPAKPTPADNQLKISYIVPQDGHVKIELFNQVGMSAATLFDGTAASGYNELLVDASALKSGAYHYRITYGGRSRVGVVMIMHH